MDPRQICPLCGFSASTAADLSIHRSCHCKVPGCPQFFASQRQLISHLIETHGYVKCTERRCGKVFRQRSQMERHYTVHGLAAGPAPAPAESLEDRTGLSWGETEGLARETLEYFGAVIGLVAEEQSKETALRGLTVRVLDGLATEKPGFPLSLYLHAMEVAMGLPYPYLQAPALPPPTEHNNCTSNTQLEIPPAPNPLSSSSDNRDGSEDVLRTTERRRVRKRKHSPSPPVLDPQSPSPPQPLNTPSKGEPPALLCIEEPCRQRFHTPKELLEHLENEHYRLKKPCS